MKFAKAVFWIAGGWGVATLTPLFFMFGTIGRQDPPAITHAQFYYGLVGVGLAWQFAFFVIATDPARFRPIMIPAIIEKLSYTIVILVLFLQKRMTPLQSATSSPDALLCLLFIAAFLKTRPPARCP
jgi:hypothetical protein